MSLTKLQLEQRIARRFAAVTSVVRLDQLELPFTRIAKPDLVLDAAVAEELRRAITADPAGRDPVTVPYWAELWESSLGLAQYIARANLTGQSVLDLGCGMGLAGAAAAALGARVLLADLEKTALLLARLNTWPWRDRVRIRRVNWQTDSLAERFEVILGADILYDAAQWEHLHQFWLAHLAPGGAILLGEPGRQTGDQFPAWAARKNWQVEQFIEPVASLPRPVRIFRLTPAPAAVKNPHPSPPPEYQGRG